MGFPRVAQVGPHDQEDLAAPRDRGGRLGLGQRHDRDARGVEDGAVGGEARGVDVAVGLFERAMVAPRRQADAGVAGDDRRVLGLARRLVDRVPERKRRTDAAALVDGWLGGYRREVACRSHERHRHGGGGEGAREREAPDGIHRRVSMPSRSTRGHPGVPLTRMVSLRVAVVDQLRAKTTCAVRVTVLRRSTLATYVSLT